MALIEKYRVIEPGDSFAERAKKYLTRKPVPDFPHNIQIQTRTGCNADCIFCPYGETYPLNPKGHMPVEVFERIIDECAEHRVHRISPYLMNEPFMDKNLFDRLTYIKRKLPRARLTVTTNGSLLKKDVVDRLLALGALDELYISFQGIEKDSYEATMRGGMKFDKTMAHVDYLLEQMNAQNLTRPVLWMTMVDTKKIDARAAVAYWKSRGVHSKYTTLENRGGNITNIDAMSHTDDMPYFDTCSRLFKQAYILFNGDMVLCCTDYYQTTILGNVVESSVYDVWNSERARAIRAAYANDRVGEIELCANCKIDRVTEHTVIAN